MGGIGSKSVVIDGPGGGQSRFVITDKKVIYPNLVEKTELVGTIEGRPVGVQVEKKPSADLLFKDEKGERRMNCDGLKNATIILGKLGIEYTFDPQAITVRLIFRESESDCFSFEFFVKWEEFSPFGAVYRSGQMEATIDLISGYVDLRRQLTTECGVAFDISYYITPEEMHRIVENSRGSSCFEEAMRPPTEDEPKTEKSSDEPADEPPHRPVEFTLDVPRILRGMIDESLKIVKVTPPVATEKDPRQEVEGRFYTLNNGWNLYVRIYRSKPDEGRLHFRLKLYDRSQRPQGTFECRLDGLLNLQIVRFNTQKVKLFVKPKKHIGLDESLQWMARYVSGDTIAHRFDSRGMLKVSFVPLENYRYYTQFTVRFQGKNFLEIRTALAEILPPVLTAKPPTEPKPKPTPPTGPPTGRPLAGGPRSRRTRPQAVAHG